MKSVANGKLFTVGIGEDEINIVHVWGWWAWAGLIVLIKIGMMLLGTPYEMGYAHGELMKDIASKFIDDVWKYLEEEVVGKCKQTEDKPL